MELSKAKQNEAKKLNVTTQYMVMADLMAIGYSEEDAYTIAYPENEAMSVQQNTGIRTLSNSKRLNLLVLRRC